MVAKQATMDCVCPYDIVHRTSLTLTLCSSHRQVGPAEPNLPYQQAPNYSKLHHIRFLLCSIPLVFVCSYFITLLSYSSSPSGLAWTVQGEPVNSPSDATFIACYHILLQNFLLNNRPGLASVMVTYFHSPSLHGPSVALPTMTSNQFQSNSLSKTMYGLVASFLVIQVDSLNSRGRLADQPML